MSIVLVSVLCFFGAITPFTERGVTDFDTFLLILDPHGQWKEVAPERWNYFPLSEKPVRPYTQGQWIYTDFGWFWQGQAPYSWACDHYGVWQRSEEGVWSWWPDPYWHPHTVDFRRTPTHIGWRPSRFTQLNEYAEKEEARFAQPAEWVFVAKEKFALPLTPADLVTGAEAAKLLEESEPCFHVFVSWREMDRLGPDPIDFIAKDRIKAPEDLKDGEPEFTSPTLWSLPTYWTPRPPDAKPEDIYIYKPKFHQDSDGIQRRILVWQRPPERKKALEKVNQVLQTPEAAPVIAPVVEAKPVVPVVTPPPKSDPDPAPTKKLVPTPTKAPNDRWKTK